MKKLSKKEKIKMRLEIFDALTQNIRKQIELGGIIPDIKVLLQPK
jgi:hypothetical protein